MFWHGALTTYTAGPRPSIYRTGRATAAGAVRWLELVLFAASHPTNGGGACLRHALETVVTLHRFGSLDAAIAPCLSMPARSHGRTLNVDVTVFERVVDPLAGMTFAW